MSNYMRPTALAVSLSLALLAWLNLGGVAAAADAGLPDNVIDASGSSSLPGVNFTKVQDLAPAKRADNRPIKNKWAVVIGVDKFVEKPLNNGLHMDKAAQDFYDYLVDPNAGRFEKDHVRILTNLNATKQSILSALGDKWLGEVAGPDDLVVIFIATHGFPAADGNTYLCAQNTVLDNVYSTGISMNDLMSKMKEQVKTDRIVIVLQACYSGAAQLTSGAKALFHFYNVDLNKFVLGKGYVILSSSRPDQVTWGDIFSKNLIKGLKEENGLVSLNKAFKFAQDKTQEMTTHDCQGCHEQIPVMKADWTGNDLVLGAPSAERTVGVPSGVVSYLAAESAYAQANGKASQGDIDGAIECYKEAIEKDPKYADAYNDYATALALKGNWAESISLYKRALAVKPDDSLFHANLARAYAKSGDPSSAVKELEAAYKLNSKDKNVLGALADMSLKQKNLARASLYLKEALQLYPSSPQLHDRLSYVLAQEAQQPGDDWLLDLALHHASKAVELDQHSLQALLNLGSVQLLKGDPAAASKAYQSAALLAPNNPDVYYLLASALEKDGNKDGAKKALQKFVEMSNGQDARVTNARTKLSAWGN